MAQQIILRRGTSSEWSAVGTSLVLAAGEPGFETNTGKLKIGNGVGVWNQLSYTSPSTLSELSDVSDIAADIGQVLTWDGTEWAATDLPEDLNTTYTISAETAGSNSATIRLTENNTIVINDINISGAGTVLVDRINENSITITGTEFDTVDNFFTGTTTVNTLSAQVVNTGKVVSSTSAEIEATANLMVRAPGGSFFGSAAAGIDGPITQIFNNSVLAAQTIAQSHNLADSAAYQWTRSRGTTSAPTIVQNGDGIGNIRYSAYNGVSQSFAAGITVGVSGSVTNGGQIPARIGFATNNGTSAALRAELTPTGVWKINQLQALTTDGNLEILNNGLGIVQLPAGTTVGGVSIGTIIIQGSVANAAALPGTSTIGYLYITQDDGHGHVWDGVAWIDVGAIQGPAGTNGVDGAPGVNGTDGVDGAPGVNGTDGVDGAPGVNGTDGVGVPVGGTPGQILAKTSATDYVTNWINNITYDQSLNTGSTVQFNSVQTAANTASMIPFYYPSLAGLPAASTSHGAVAHAHDTGKLYYAHAGSWIALANVSDLSANAGDVVGPSSATDNAIARYDSTTGKLLQDSLVTIADTGAITAPNNTGSMIPFYYPTLASFPAAANSHGAVAHAHDTGKMYYAHAGVWIELANVSELLINDGDTVGPSSATDNAIARYDLATGKLLQNSPVTVADNGAIVAPQAGSVIPFYFANQAAFPSAVTYHGAIAHSHSDGKMYYAHAGAWSQLANSSELPTDIFDLGIVDGTVGQVLTTDGAGNLTFTTVASSAVGVLNDLTDVIIATPTIGQVLKYDGANWVNGTDNTATVFTRQTVSGSTGSLANGDTGTINITGFKSYTLLKVQTSAAAWVRIYVSEAARIADATRTEGEDPLPGAGIIAEVITTGAETVLITPGAIGFNDEAPVTTNIPCRVTNKSGNPASITVTLTAVQLEA